MKILYVTTISLTMNSFFKPHIEMLVQDGHQVDVACNDKELALDPLYDDLGCKKYRIDFSRSPLSRDNITAYAQLKYVVENGGYDIVHCHTPNASVITRMVCRTFRKKRGLRVFYTAHGFHFYRGAPALNWFIYYPIEKICAKFTDELITINQEDYELAKKKFRAKSVHYVPGVGLDISKFENISVIRSEKRQELGVPEDAFLLLSVGELNENKNHQVVIRALAGLKSPNVHYAIAGIGDMRDSLWKMAEDLGVADQVHLLGYRRDVAELYAVSELFCFPSFREGLSVSLMEAMASGLPVVCSRIRGNVDLIDQNTGFLFDPFSVKECENAIEQARCSELQTLAERSKCKVMDFSREAVLKKVSEWYQ